MMQAEKHDNIKVMIDGREVAVSSGETILEAARRENIHIPTLCHDPRLKPFSSCFLCVVKVEGMKGLQPSCSTPLSGGMKITTTGEVITEARRTALELLLSNHYADCLGPCKLNCPAGVDVQGYISLVEKGLYSEAVALIKETNPLPAICGRVCVRPCELVCRRNLLEEGKGVGIDYLKRYAADVDMAASDRYTPVPDPATGKKIAIVGAGPAGLSAAWWLSLKGHTCHIYEAAPLPGGWLRYGIPEYRLPNDILDKEVESISRLGVEIFCNTRLGRDISYAEINKRYDAMILSPGSQLGTRLGCEGDEAEGVMPGIDFLREMELTGVRPDLTGKKVIVVGGGNTAMDCCRTAVRCGAESVKVVYRRSEKEMPANPIEIEESKNEGVEYMFLTNPVRVIPDDKGTIRQMMVIRMELGEPDSSGRRRPVEVPGSEFIIDADLVLAAIGQKTDLSFIDDINSNTTLGEFRRNKWGEIETNPLTLETGVANVFAAGDAVTGPDTIIGAIAQARRAALSCHQYLSGEAIVAEPEMFVSRRENFRPPGAGDLPQRVSHQKRHEMPLLAPEARKSFNEVELGYASEMIVREEASRCLECGCVAFPGCDLQHYSNEYGAVQKKYSGDFLALPPDDTHPFITFDLNKCILCGRCVRICHEMAGADALGFQERGFRTMIGPGPGLRLADTYCSSCGLCISTCPTGAITENTPFKPGPVETTSFVTTDFIGSEGASVRLHRRKDFFTGAEGSAGIVNPDASIGNEGRFSYRILNLPRLTKPVLKEKDGYREISFEEAYRLMAEKIRGASGWENAFSGGARLTNEELCLIGKLAEKAPGGAWAGSFHYLEGGSGYLDAADKNITINDLGKAEQFYIFGADLFARHQLTGFRVFNRSSREENVITYITTGSNTRMERKAGRVIRPVSYLYFVRSVISYILRNNLQNDIFIKTCSSGFEDFRREALSSDHQSLVERSGVPDDIISSFADEYNDIQKAVLIFAEEDVNSETAAELHNLCLLTGKLGKEGSGILCLRRSCNSQGLIDLGLAQSSAPEPGSIRNMFIFGEDPVGLAIDRKKTEKMFSGLEFLVVQDFNMTPTAKRADLVLPATWAFESGGSFTGSARIININEMSYPGPVRHPGIRQIASVIHELGGDQSFDVFEVHDEMLAEITGKEAVKHDFIVVAGESSVPWFRHGCNSVSALFETQVMSVE